uniref:MYND-type domain-containing protein n=1 Tax=Clastoptera arizonana TaxID=38151 RepID=A0A1B6CI05_9HEMI
MENIALDLGFLEEVEPWKLESRYFPSKVGGKPAWLELSSNILNFSSLMCHKCQEPLIFMCQVYAPIETDDKCFHRTIFVFICRNEKCCLDNCASNVKVFRNQLKRDNCYYPFDPPTEDETWRNDLTAELFNVKLCEICGIKSSSYCAKCKFIYYCSKSHQVYDWKNRHKAECDNLYTAKSDTNNKLNTSFENSILFPEFELVMESEDVLDKVSTNAVDSNLEMIKYNEMVAEGEAGVLHDVPAVEEELAKFALGNDDKAFTKFKDCIKHSPDQVMRYNRGGKPLWISDLHQPSESDVPNCQYCDGKRIFEFQILPQMLNYLGLETTKSSIDWGTLAIYTCENSCKFGPSYKEEFVWKQDIQNK